MSYENEENSVVFALFYQRTMAFTSVCKLMHVFSEIVFFKKIFFLSLSLSLAKLTFGFKLFIAKCNDDSLHDLSVFLVMMMQIVFVCIY